MSVMERVLERYRAEAAARGRLAAGAHFLRLAVGRFLYEWLDEVSISCDFDQLGEFPASDEFEMSEARPSDVEELVRFALHHADEADAEKLRGYLRNGYCGQLARIGGELVGYVWSVDASVPADRTHPALLRFGYRLGPHDTYSWDLYLAPEFRGRGRARAFYGRSLAALRDKGYRRVYGWVLADNTPARLLYQKLGWIEFSERRSLLLFGRVLVTGRRVFLRNRPGRVTPYDYRLLLGS